LEYFVESILAQMMRRKMKMIAIRFIVNLIKTKVTQVFFDFVVEPNADETESHGWSLSLR
jgi:hypothetical protein